MVMELVYRIVDRPFANYTQYDYNRPDEYQKVDSVGSTDKREPQGIYKGIDARSTYKSRTKAHRENIG